MADPSLYEAVSREMAQVLASAREKSAGGLSLKELGQLMVDTIGAFVRIAATLQASGSDKKEVVIGAVEQFWHEVVTPLDIPYLPNVIESVVDKKIEAAIRPAIEGVVEGIYRILKDAGVVA